MSPKAQRIAIAEACGWKGPYHPENVAGMVGWWSQERGAWWMKPDGERVMISSVPDYLSDLNAMQDAEKVLTGRVQEGEYWHQLRIKVTRDLDGAMALAIPELCISATAAQRCEALLRTLDLWDDTK